MKILFILGLLFLAGCAEIRDTGVENEQRYKIGYGGNFTVKEITLGDGTRCVVLGIYKGGGISCDWK